VSNEFDAPGLATRVDGGDTRLTLSGDWTLPHAGSLPNVGPAPAGSDAWFDRQDLKAILFDTGGLGRWDTSLLVYLARLRRDSALRSIRFEDAGIPSAARRLLALLPDGAAPPAALARRPGLVERVGLNALSTWSEGIAVTTLLGGQLL
jgi:phospholipid/cholesterol/gamma-HCH transport system permease protein